MAMQGILSHVLLGLPHLLILRSKGTGLIRVDYSGKRGAVVFQVSETTDLGGRTGFYIAGARAVCV